MAAHGQTPPVCPNQNALIPAVETVVGKLNVAAPPQDTNPLAAALARPFEDCHKTLSDKPVCRYALAARVGEIYMAWKDVQPATLKARIATKQAELKAAQGEQTAANTALTNARAAADQLRSDENIDKLVKAEATAKEKVDKVSGFQEELNRLNAELSDTPKAVKAVVEAQSALLSGDVNTCFSGTDYTAALCHQARDNAMYDVDRMIRQEPSTSPDKLQKRMNEANAFCETVAKNLAFHRTLAQDDFKEKINSEICEWKAASWKHFLYVYYGLKKQEKAIRIKSATFGDHAHGHVCDARAYFQQRCGQLPGETAPAAGSRYCLMADITGRATLCGYDPSPQADLSLRISYFCDNDATKSASEKNARSIDVPFSAGKLGRVDLICQTETFVDTASPGEDAAKRTARFAALKTFFAQPPCPYNFPEAK